MEGWWNRHRPRMAGLAAGLLFFGLVTAACGGGAGANKSEITIGYTEWPEDIAVAYLWESIIEKRGYEVELRQRQVDTLFAEMAVGKIDMFMDTWLPGTHEMYWDDHGEQLEKLTQWYDEATLELAVPTYMNAESINDLAGYADQLEGKIIGIEAAAGETAAIKTDVLPEYGLRPDLRYVSSSTTGMLASLEGAIKNHEYIVVALWHPHWAYDEFPIKDLEDPKSAWGAPEQLHVTARQEFDQERPQVARWIANFHLSRKQLRPLLVTVVRDARNPGERRQAVQTWIGKHRELVQTWAGPSR